MANTPSFQDLLNSFADEVFVGRGEQLTLFESALEASQPPFLILNISGQGGVGKTTLLERYSQISKNKKVAYANVTEDHLEIPKILETFVTQLEKDGLDFDNFKERYKKYRELQEKVESDPKVPSGLMDFALRGIAKIGVKSLKRIPVAGDVADVFLSPESEEVIAEQASEFTKYIFQKFTNKDERVLLLNTDAELTRYFLEDITKSLKNKKAVLSFDTYEKTSTAIEKWLINLLLGGYGEFSSNLFFVIAGRYSLGQSWTRFRKAIRQIELKEFTEDEAKDYLIRSGITDESLISQFIEVTERLPVLLALLVSSPNQLPHDVSGDAVQRFLQGLTPEQQEAALICSLPRYFNHDILSAILGENEGKIAFEWLSNAHFVRTSENGWVYHDVVRAMMLRYFRMRSNQQFIDIHKKLEEYFQDLIRNLLDNKDDSKIITATNELESEKIYHFLYQNPNKNFEYVVRQSLREIGKILKSSLSFNEIEDSSEALGSWLRVRARALQQISDEISEFVETELTDHYKQFSNLFLGKFIAFNTKDFTWVSNIKNLDNEEEIGMLFFELIVNSKNEEDISNYINMKFLDKLMHLNPNATFGYLARAEYHQTRKNYDLALLDISKAFELQPNDAYNYYTRGVIYHEMKEYLKAVTDFSKAIELQPEDGDNYFQRGLTYYDMKDFPNALADFSKTIELQPEDGVNYFWRGRVYISMEDYLNALTDLSKDIELRPNKGYNFYWLGAALTQTKDYPNALTNFSKAIELQPDEGDNYYGRGLTYYNMKDYPNALNDFSKAIELMSDSGYFYYWRGLTYYNMKDYPNALTDFSKDIEIRAESEDGYYRRGLTYYKLQDYPNALTDLSKAVELKPESGYNLFWRGLTYYNMKDYPNALTDFSKDIEIRPENEGGYYRRGLTYYELQDYPNALIDLSKAVELKPEGGYNLYWRGMTYYKMQEYLNALTDFSKDIELRPEFGYNYYRLAICNFVANKKQVYKENIAIAVQKLEAMQESEKDWEDKLMLALFYLANKEHQKAKSLYEDIINECSDKSALEYGLENLIEFIELVGNSKESKRIEKMLKTALSK